MRKTLSLSIAVLSLLTITVAQKSSRKVEPLKQIAAYREWTRVTPEILTSKELVGEQEVLS